jgi:hypothetical protein
MSKNKRIHVKQVVSTNKGNPKSQQEQCCAVAKKMMKHFGFDPNLIEIFTKKQKQALFSLCFDTPIVKPYKVNTVPRQHVKSVHAETFKYMRTNFYGQPEEQLSYMDVFIYGASFMVNMQNLYKNAGFLPGTPQEELARQINDKYEKDNTVDPIVDGMLNNVWYLTRGLSKVNFRFYGFLHKLEQVPSADGRGMLVKIVIRLTAKDSESKKFTYNGVERKAFRLLVPDGERYGSYYATIKRNKIFSNAKDDELFNLYIQSHVLHRYKERVDLFGPELQNLFLQYAFTRGVDIVHQGNKILFTSLIEDDKKIGYFTCFIQDDDIVINTFLPLTSDITPEGKKLHDILSLGKEDIVYLGMDKLSFLTSVDFEQVPALKHALIESGIWETKVLLDEMLSRDNDLSDKKPDEKKTSFLKDFFDKREAHRADVSANFNNEE